MAPLYVARGGVLHREVRADGSRGSGTRIVLDRAGFTEDHWESFRTGWPGNYWEPLRKYLNG